MRSKARSEGEQDAFVARLDTVSGGTTGTNQFLTFLGGSGDDAGTGIAIDSARTRTSQAKPRRGNFPTASPFQASPAGCRMPS